MAVITALAIGSLSTPAAAEEFTRTLKITGSGQVSAVPNIAHLSAGVVTQAKTAKEALASNSEKMRSVMDAMSALGIAKKDIQTSNFSVRPQYQRYEKLSSGATRPPQIVGYEVRNQVSVKIRDLKQSR